ncbi:hypothetical protein SLE2022_110290 [Rubroshorea leprosula]
MAASVKLFTVENHTQNGDWTVVLPRRGRKKKNIPKVTAMEEQERPWVPTDLQIDLDTKSKLIKKMQICMKRIEGSQFYLTFLDQMQTPEVLNCFRRVLGSELKLKMVIYGIGSIESYETPRFQLSLAILMKRRFSWIGDIEVFDPILSATESCVLEEFGCSVLSVNEQGKRHVLKPTLFFMPHCEAVLYNNLLKANWTPESLNHMLLFGNSFETYEQDISMFKNPSIVNSAMHILAARKFTVEFRIKTVSDDYFPAFHDSSWHFFSPNHEAELQMN